MRVFLDHPAIANALETGYPTERTRWPHCPVCGAECDVVMLQGGEAVGCDVCLLEVDAWQYDGCFPEEGDFYD